MRTKKNFKLRPLGKDFILTAEGESQVNFNKMISFNATAAFLWQSVEGKEFTAGTVSDLLAEKYGIDRELADKDAGAICAKWMEAGIVED